MSTALVLIDVQNDYLTRDTLVPPHGELVARLASLLEGCRRAEVPVAHVRTLIRPDGTNRMPHWKRDDYWACVEGTAGCEPPPALVARGGEPVIGKSFYSGFSNPALDGWLQAAGAATLVLAGVYLHACISATALDAYQRGYEVWVAEDSVATMRADQADVAEDFLSGRAATFLRSSAIVARLGVD